MTRWLGCWFSVFPVFASAFNASTRAARKCSEEFEQVKSQRFHRFSQCFEHVAIIIDQIYKRICRNSSAQVKQRSLSKRNTSFTFFGFFLVRSCALTCFSPLACSPVCKNYWVTWLSLGLCALLGWFSAPPTVELCCPDYTHLAYPLWCH